MNILNVSSQIVKFSMSHDCICIPGNDAEKCGVCNEAGLSSGGELNVDEKQIDTGRTRCKCYNQELDVFENLRHIQEHRVGSAVSYCSLVQRSVH